MKKYFEATIDKIIPNPLTKVYETWINPDLLQHWFGPAGHIVIDASFDVTINGKYTISMKAPEGKTYTLTGKFLEIIAYEKLVYTWQWDQIDLGNYEIIVTVKFLPENNTTRLVIHHKKFLQEDQCEGHKVGWSGSITRITEYFKIHPYN